MYYFNRFILILILFSVYVSALCQTVIKVGKNDFPQKVKIKGQEILANDFNHHHKILIIDEYILTLVNGGKYNYNVFDKKTEQYLGPIGVRGEGPEEWLIPQTTLGQYIKKDGETYMWYFDYLRGTFSLMNLTKTLKSKSVNPINARRLRVNMKLFPYFQLFMGDNEKMYGTNWIYESDRSRLKSYDLKSNKIAKSALFPKIKNSTHLPSEVLNSLYSGSFDKHPAKDQFVQATFIFNRIDVFDENLNLIKSIVDGENWKNDYYEGREIIPSENFVRPRIDGFNGLSVSKNFIFALEAKKNVGTDKEKENESFVRVYNWNGAPIVYLEINHDLSSIDFDEDTNILYATDYSHELVLKFNLIQYLPK
jgi:hypothetical protein